MWNMLLMVVMFVAAVVLILLVLVQRGKGGGLAGALGGMGGQSAFGTKAGDTFTRITIGVATFWILLCVVSVGALRHRAGKLDVAAPTQAPAAPSQDAGSPAGGPPAAPAAPAGEAPAK
ncbi:MAG: preprotein translocase subunit SecG [Thermoguttaceae bacterium]|jgi:preprotein translocase subunit SecG